MPEQAFNPVTPARLSWRGDDPFATDYDDIYFATDGIAEVRRVFMQPADVSDRMANGQLRCIGELGFGTGLNFAVCAEAWLSSRADGCLHFISFEKHPLTQADWQRVGATYKSTLPIYQDLLQQPLPVLPGWHQRFLANGRICLSVFHGDAQVGLQAMQQQLRQPVDAWFLDGFAPDKNPDMWQPALFGQLIAASATARHHGQHLYRRRPRAPRPG